MTTMTTPDVTSAAEHEFALPCQAAADTGCEQPASWAGWLAHAVGGCNITTTVCDMHQKLMDEVWLAAMEFQPTTCPHCGEPVSRNIDDNLKWIRL